MYDLKLVNELNLNLKFEINVYAYFLGVLNSSLILA